MTTGLSLENLARVVHADQQLTFAMERFARQVASAQSHTTGDASGVSWGERIRRILAHHLVVTVAIRPPRLTLQWL
jgi:hypothetical protein